MSTKTTQRITRQEALLILLREISNLSNDVLGDMMDILADSEQSNYCSRFDNFIVSEFTGDDENKTED